MSVLLQLFKKTFLDHPAIVQGLYYIPTGIWPLLHMSSFLKITGPKTDLWLVNTVGLLLVVTGSVLLLAGLRNNYRLEFLLLGIGSAACLTAIEIFYVSSGTISAIYLLDSFVEILLIGGWFSRWFSQSAPDDSRNSE